MLFRSKKLNINLLDITHVVCSHQHWDHTAGFEEILQNISSKAKVYLPYKFSSSLLKLIPPNIELICTKSFSQVAPNIYLCALKGHTTMMSDCFFLYEQNLIFNTSKGLVILTGCGHPGVLNIVRYVYDKLHTKVHLLIGGFHLHHSFNFTINNIIEGLQKIGIENVAPCHCTGDQAIRKLQKCYGNHCYTVGTGFVIEI